MFNWILDNREWLFSGIGVSFIGLLIYAVRHRLFRRTVPTPPSPIPVQSPPTKKVIPISPADVLGALSGVPDLQKDDVFRSYKGMHVEWVGTLLNAGTLRSGTNTAVAHLQLGYNETEPGFYKALIYAHVDLNAHPELKVTPKGTRIKVRGDIYSYGGYDGITLRDCQIEIPEPDQQ